MKSGIKKRSIVIEDHKTSISLEEKFWEGLIGIAKLRGTTISNLVSAIDDEREHANLSSAIRVFVLNHFQSRSVVPTNGKAKPRSVRRSKAESPIDLDQGTALHGMRE